MHRSEHARADEESADQREREGDDGKEDGPAFQRVALLDDDRRMDERGADEPRHEGRVLDRVPEPPAAPAERVIGPPASHRDADGQGAPGGKAPWPNPARPGGIDPAFDQRGDGEGYLYKQKAADEIKKRRMEGEAGVLQHRIHAVAVER